MGREEWHRDSVRRVSARRLADQRQPDSRVNVEQNAGPDTEINLALDRVRAGDIQLG